MYKRQISVSAGKKKIPSPTFTDHDLDPRLRYSAIVPSRYMVGANVLLTDAAGKLRYKTSVNGFDRVLLPQEITSLPGIRLTVSDMLTFNKGDITEFTVETKLKDPAQPLYAKGSSAGNTLRNYSVLKSSDGESLSSGASVKIRPAGRVFTALKTIDDAKAILTGNERVYSVGSEVENDYSDPSVNFELTDLIPKGVDVKDIRLTEAFARLPGAGYELIPNYHNTGRTAVRFTADEVENEEQLRHIADISVYFSVMVDDSNKTVENDAYVRATGKHTAYRNEVENPPAGPGKWSKAAVVSSISTTKEVYIEKKVRQKGRQEWKDKIQTAPGARIEYSLRVVNGTVLQIESPVIYDVLPYKGDKTLFTGERNSQFSNRLGDTPITLPQGWNVRYTCDPNVNNNNLTSVSWQSERCADVTALRFAGDVIPPRTDVRVILPMTAGPKGSAPGSREHLYQSAVNHFIYNDKNRKNAAGYGNAIESNRASNELIPPLSHITFKKLGMNIVKGHGVVSRDPLAGALFGLYDGGGKLRQKAVSNKDGEVSFTAPAERGWFVRELRAPAGFGLSEIIYTLGEKDFTDLDEKNGVYNVRIKDVVDFPKFIPVIPGIGSVEFTKVDVEGKPLSLIHI